MKKLWLTVFYLLCIQFAIATSISGIVKDIDGTVLPYATISVGVSGISVVSNGYGLYMLHLPAGAYSLHCQLPGYATSIQEVQVGNTGQMVNFTLGRQPLQFDKTINPQGEDPAYAIIRQTIDMRRQQAAAFQYEVYTKGVLTLRTFPFSVFGQKAAVDIADIGRNGIVYFSETKATYSQQAPNKEKVFVSAERSIGQGDGLGFAKLRPLNFYDNIVRIADTLNPRGFVSPIADNAMRYYRYRYMGSYTEDNHRISRIMVIPQRGAEPVFHGYINIVEDEWWLQSVTLMLTKAAQLEVADSVKVEQLYMPVDSTWMVKTQVVQPAFRLPAFNAIGSFVSVLNNYALHPTFAQNHFDNILIRYAPIAETNTYQYWERFRPMQLENDEILDYLERDRLKADNRYIDSLDKIRNRINIPELLLFGQGFFWKKNNSSLSYKPLIEEVNYNTVEGLNVNISPTYTRRFSPSRTLTATPTIRYGFSNHHFNADLAGTYSFGKRYPSAITVAGGKRVFQFDNTNPILPAVNTYATLLAGYNYMKIYEAWYAKMGYAKELGQGFRVSGDINFQDRIPLENISNAIWTGAGKLSRRTPNYPTGLMAENFIRHRALSAGISISYQPGARYAVWPDHIVNLGSVFPVFSLSYTKGLKDVLNSIADYDKWNFSVKGSASFNLYGRTDYLVTAGGFMRDKLVPVQDYQHFAGNRTLVAANYLGSFQLLPYYQWSNTAPLQSTLHLEHHFNGLLTNRIPWVKRLNVYLVAGVNGLVVKDRQYWEGFVGVENILKTIRIDYVFGYGDFKSSGIRIGIKHLGY